MRHFNHQPMSALISGRGKIMIALQRRGLASVSLHNLVATETISIVPHNRKLENRHIFLYFKGTEERRNNRGFSETNVCPSIVMFLFLVQFKFTNCFTVMMLPL